MIKGVLFDMDGVLVDSEAIICRAAVTMFSETGVTVSPEDFHPFVGTGENRYIGGVAEKYGVTIDITSAKARVYELYESYAQEGLTALPGALDLVNHCRLSGLMTAVATSADKVKMEINLAGIGLPESAFDAIVTGEDVIHKKPAPDIYLEAAARLGLEADECLVIEDAVSGIKAAKSAGCRCLAVTTSYSADRLHEADWICASLTEIPADALKW